MAEIARTVIRRVCQPALTEASARCFTARGRRMRRQQGRSSSHLSCRFFTLKRNLRLSVCQIFAHAEAVKLTERERHFLILFLVFIAPVYILILTPSPSFSSSSSIASQRSFLIPLRSPSTFSFRPLPSLLPLRCSSSLIRRTLFFSGEEQRLEATKRSVTADIFCTASCADALLSRTRPTSAARSSPPDSQPTASLSPAPRVSADCCRIRFETRKRFSESECLSAAFPSIHQQPKWTTITVGSREPLVNLCSG
ncbi:uncharacterized protein LOC122866499 isoform X2 [Siniperca chuatsi]|uniref:uncharacterized protein LOC122866499 isoform X2 n=1 Tax=Siniperca chuatsi TaxID=119488 RepID=UPI001CE178CE|nr:uncharacterized protein LOC122866499 isoform X2 [Siniperca chuatsi]